MKELTKIAKILGEENEQRLKNEITDLLIHRIEDDLDNYEDWIVDLNELYKEVNKEVQKAVKDKMIKHYTEKFEEKMNAMFKEQFGE